jgi:hypothetical protein
VFFIAGAPFQKSIETAQLMFLIACIKMNQKFCRRALRGRRQPVIVKIRSFCYALKSKPFYSAIASVAKYSGKNDCQSNNLKISLVFLEGKGKRRESIALAE